jgi:hypothetical protein
MDPVSPAARRRRGAVATAAAAAAAAVAAAGALAPAAGGPPDPSTLHSVPLFAHVRWANFSASDLAGLARFRSVTIQVEPDAPIPCEAQAVDARAKLRGAGSPVPVLFYTNLFYSEPNCVYNAAVTAAPWLWLNDSSGAPYMPGGRRTFDLSAPGAPAWWATHVAGAAGVDGGFGDSGCGGAPSWLNASHAAAFAAGQAAAHAAATASAWGDGGGLWVANCPVLPQIGDKYIPGTRGEMIESWCSDFYPGGGGTASFCRDELLEAVALSGWGNMSLQARYYLNSHNGYNPEFGLAAFLIAAWPGAFYGASRDWDWAGDWEALLAWPWASRAPGNATGPPKMLDPDGCGWAREYAGANVTVNLCAKHFFAQILWAGNATTEEGATGGASAASIGERGRAAAPPARPAAADGGPPRRRKPRSVAVTVPKLGEGCPARHAAVEAPWAAGGLACVGFAVPGGGGGGK